MYEAVLMHYVDESHYEEIRKNAEYKAPEVAKIYNGKLSKIKSFYRLSHSSEKRNRNQLAHNIARSVEEIFLI